MTTTIQNLYSPSGTSDFYSINLSQESLQASLSGELDDYDITQSGPTSIIVRAKESYQSRYRTAAMAEKRLLRMEETLRSLKNDHETLKNDHKIVKNGYETLMKDKEDVRLLMLRSQIYTKLLSSIQNHLYSALPNDLQQQLLDAGLANLPRTFVIWWTVWNKQDPITFCLPPSISNCVTDPQLLTFSRLLINHRGNESRLGIVVRRACWCKMKACSGSRNHPDATKAQVENIIDCDLCDELKYLYSCAISYVSKEPGFTI